MNRKKNPYLIGIILFIVSYVFQIGGLIPLVWAVTMKSTYEYELAEKIKDTDLAELFGVAQDLKTDMQKVNVVLCIGAVILAVGLLLMIAATVITIVKHNSRKNAVNYNNPNANGYNVPNRSDAVPAGNLYNAPYAGYSEDRFFNSGPSMSRDNYGDNSYYYRNPGCMPNQKGLYQGSLMCLSGLYCGCSFPLCNNEEVIIGTNPQLCNIVLNHDGSGVSRFHCSVKFDYFGNCYVVTDYSMNGTFVSNGRRLPSNVPVKLRRGETIFLCDGSNSFRME